MKYTKLSLSLLSLTLLAACGEQTSESVPVAPSESELPTETTKPSEPPSTELEQTMLNPLAEGFSARGFDHIRLVMAGDTGEETQVLEQSLYMGVAWNERSTYSSTGEIVLKQDHDLVTPEDIESVENEAGEKYVADEDGFLAREVLTLKNTVDTIPLVLQETGESVLYDSIYTSPFVDAYAGDFESVDGYQSVGDRLYAFELATTDPFYRADTINAFSTFLLGTEIILGEPNDPEANIYLYTDGYNLTGFELVLGADPFDVTGEEGAPEYGERLSFNIIETGAATNVAEIQPVTGTADPALAEALTTLSTATSYTNTALSTILFGSTPLDQMTTIYQWNQGKLIAEGNDGSATAYLDTAEGVLVGEGKVGEDRYEIFNTIEGAMLSDMLPDLNVSPLLFNKTDEGKYELNLDIPGLYVEPNYSIAFLGDVTHLEIALTDDLITFKTTGQQDSGMGFAFDVVTEETYSNVGTTEVELTEANFVTKTVDSLFDMLSADDQELISQYFYQEHLEIIPNFEGYTSAMVAAFTVEGQQQPGFVITYPDEASATEALTAYLANLTANNWTQHPTVLSYYFYNEVFSVEFQSGVEDCLLGIQIQQSGDENNEIWMLPGYYDPAILG